MINESLISQRVQESIEVKKKLLGFKSLIKEISQKIVHAYRNNNKVILFGNGGSAADAQHIAAELTGKYYLVRKSLPAIALTVNASNLTAIANDYSFNHVFSRQLEGIGNEGDIAIGISTGGNSENVLEALQLASENGLVTIGLTGQDGGKMKDIVDLCLRVPSDDTPRIQEAHTVVGHIICEIVEKELFQEGDQ